MSKSKPNRHFLKATNQNDGRENIDDLTIVNTKREPAGLIDSQDLPKLKIM